jgi:hypothetical protein
MSRVDTENGSVRRTPHAFEEFGGYGCRPNRELLRILMLTHQRDRGDTLRVQLDCAFIDDCSNIGSAFRHELNHSRLGLTLRCGRHR